MEKASTSMSGLVRIDTFGDGVTNEISKALKIKLKAEHLAGNILHKMKVEAVELEAPQVFPKSADVIETNWIAYLREPHGAFLQIQVFVILKGSSKTGWEIKGEIYPDFRRLKAAS